MQTKDHKYCVTKSKIENMQIREQMNIMNFMKLKRKDLVKKL